MGEATDAAVDPGAVQVDPLPDAFARGTTVLLAGAGDPARYALALRALRRRGTAAEPALVVTTTESAEATLDAYAALQDGGPSLALADAASSEQYVTARYDETPTAFVPSPGDLERLVVSLSELSGTRPPAGGTRHFAVRSLTPVLRSAPTGRVCTVLERITGLRSGSGVGVFGVDYTAHDENTIAALSDRVDAVLRAEWRAEDRLAFEFDPASSGRADGSDPGGRR